MIAGAVTGSPEWYAAREEILRAAWEGLDLEPIEDIMHEGEWAGEAEY